MKRRYTLRDESLPHQIIIDFGGISCNCWMTDRQRRESRGRSRSNPKPFAPFGTLEEAWAAYRDPANHRSEEC
jgi:hypothetical protein